MRVWWGSCLAAVLLYSTVPVEAATRPAASVLSAQVSPEISVALGPDYAIDVLVKTHPGDAWTRFAKRLTGAASNWEILAATNGGNENLKRDQVVRVPFALLRPEIQRDALAKLFPKDRKVSGGWQHVVVGDRGVEGESLWSIAEWFTGDGSNYTAIRKANPGQGLSTRKGDVILVPKQILTAAFGGQAEGKDASTATAEVRESENDPVERAAANEDVQDASETVVAAGQPSLNYVRAAGEPHAVYRLQKGEALYSSVAIRFTGRVYAKDVNEVLARIVEFNNIPDVSRLPVGYAVKIPLDLLLPEYLPSDDPERLARETSKRESARLAKRSTARGLAGVHVIIDAGHGGRDVGTYHEGTAESAYVYDVAVRLKKILEKNSAAAVSMTTKSKSLGFKVQDRDELPTLADHLLLTTPEYDLDDAVVGVNLRWYLANSMFARAVKKNAEAEKVIFISIHADSLHPSLRGAMAYIPGADHAQGTYAKKGEVYLARAEVRERPLVKVSAKDALVAEGLSRGLAESVIEAFSAANMKVHPFNPVRDNVVRGGREWVPAVIRHNVVPTRMLLEVCNLGNKKDRQLMQTRKYRQQVAEAIYGGIGRFFEQDRDERTSPVLASRAR